MYLAQSHSMIHGMHDADGVSDPGVQCSYAYGVPIGSFPIGSLQSYISRLLFFWRHVIGKQII